MDLTKCVSTIPLAWQDARGAFISKDKELFPALSQDTAGQTPDRKGRVLGTVMGSLVKNESWRL